MDCPRKKKRFVVESWPLVPEIRLYSLLITAHAHRSQETVYLNSIQGKMGNENFRFAIKMYRTYVQN